MAAFPVRIVEIRSAMGGDDAAKFAFELRRAYLRYAIREGWTTEILDESSPSNGLIKSSVVRVSGKTVRQMDSEAGTHRVTRVPSNERTGRRHTSAVTVVVLPVPDNPEVAVRMSDVRIDTFRGTGPGGQHRNKTDSAVRITHIPTGLVAVSQDDRSQHTNKARAFEVLAARLAKQSTEKVEAVRDRSRAAMHGSGHIAERQRSYLWREGVAVDHASGVRVPLNRALDGELSAFAQH